MRFPSIKRFATWHRKPVSTIRRLENTENDPATISPTSTTAIGYHETYPVDSNSTQAGPSRQADATSGPDAGADLRKFGRLHRWDPFLDVGKLDQADAAVRTGDPEKEGKTEAELLERDSPYAEVRAAVKPVDDPELPVDTIRPWTIGAILCTLVAACNILLGLRRSPITISATVVQLIAYPIGLAWHRFMPTRTLRLFSYRLPLNPGPFNTKEHTLVTIMTAAGASVSYAIDILLAQELFYHQFFSWGFQLLLIISTQAMGYGLAGVLRRFLVWPAAMVWPSTLITTTVMHSLHDHSPSDPAATNGWRIGRYRFFLYVALGTFAWEWVPEVLAQFLQLFTFICWMAPDNVLVNQVFGGITGLGIVPLSFDWSTVSGFLSSPLPTPAFVLFNVAAGLVFMIIGCAGLAWAGPEFYRYLPISANKNFDHFGKSYNVSRILTPQFTFNQTAFDNYSPLFIGPAFSFSYGLSFATLISTIVHVSLFYGRDIVARARSLKFEEADVHLKLMRSYREVPGRWFMLIFVVSFGFGLATSQAWPTNLPWWAYIIALVISSVLALPVGIIQAITNQQTGLNVITELIVGYMLPGRPIAMMLFKSWGYMTAFNCLNYVSDMKIGHYMKIPPRSMFAAQLFAVVWLSVVQVAAYNFLRGHISDICTETNAQGLTCPGARTFFNASVIWGVLGPAKMFSRGQLYSWINWFWFIGAVLPAAQYFLAKRYPRSLLRYVFFPAMFGAASMIPPATVWWLGQWVIVGLIFNFGIRRKYFGWWSRYNYVLSGAMDIGTALCIVISALALGLSGVEGPSWWGNTVFNDNLDASGTAVTKRVPDDGTFFGPRVWH